MARPRSKPQMSLTSAHVWDDAAGIPENDWCRKLFEHIYSKLDDGDFADLYEAIGLDLIAPPWRNTSRLPVPAGSLHFDFTQQIGTCPEGHRSISWRPNGRQIDVRFEASTCQRCPHHSECVRTKANSGRKVAISRRYDQLLLDRERAQTTQWQKFRTPDMGTRSDVHFLGLGSPCRAAGVRHSEFSSAQFRADSSPLRAKVNCECLTPAVLLKALRDLESGHLSPATPDRRSPLAQGLIASQTGNVRSSEVVQTQEFHRSDYLRTCTLLRAQTQQIPRGSQTDNARAVCGSRTQRAAAAGLPLLAGHARRGRRLCFLCRRIALHRRPPEPEGAVQTRCNKISAGAARKTQNASAAHEPRNANAARTATSHVPAVPDAIVAAIEQWAARACP